MSDRNVNSTINYYDENSSAFVESTRTIDFSAIQNKFLSYLSKNAKILDFGCGSGRDTKYFLNKGYKVDAIDGSKKLCQYASKYTGIEVKNMLFQELNAVDQYDGIWACSSILHLDKDELSKVLNKMSVALKKDGIIYTSFKYSEFEGVRNGRYFTDFTEKTFQKFLEQIHLLIVETQWITGDARPEREDERWLNLILKKSIV